MNLIELLHGGFVSPKTPDVAQILGGGPQIGGRCSHGAMSERIADRLQRDTLAQQLHRGRLRFHRPGTPFANWVRQLVIFLKGSGMNVSPPNRSLSVGTSSLALAFVAVTASDAWAYIDPGTGSYLFQVAARAPLHAKSTSSEVE